MHPPALGSKGMREAHTTNDDQQNREHEEKKEKNRKNANSFCNFFFLLLHTKRPGSSFSFPTQTSGKTNGNILFSGHQRIKPMNVKELQLNQYDIRNGLDGLGGFPTSCHDATLYLQ